MKKFKSVKNEEVVVELVSEEAGKVTVKYESGEEKSISPSTLKRWWKELPEEEATDEEVITQPNDDAIDALKYAIKESNAEDPVEEAPATEAPKVDKKPKKEKEPKAKKEKITGDHPLKVFIEALATQHGTEVFTPATVASFRSLKVSGKMYMAFTFNIKGVTLWLRSKALPEKTEFKKMNHMFDARIKFAEDTKENRDTIKKLLEASLNYQRNK